MRKFIPILAPFLLIASAQAGFVSSKCLSPLEELINAAKSAESFKKPIPVECQYYKLEDLNEKTRTEVIQLLKERKESQNLDAKISSLFGILSKPPAPDAESRDNDQDCEKKLRDASEKANEDVEKVKTYSECVALKAKFYPGNEFTGKCAEKILDAKIKFDFKCNIFKNR